jgi:uncharacterized protein YjbI with pentapeptide repeats
VKTVKPQKLGLLTRVFEDRGTNHLVVTGLLIFPFESPTRLDKETSLWKICGKELGETPLDLLLPKAQGEVLVTGKGYTHGGPRPACSVRVQLGPVDKTLWIVGNRRWKLGAATDPEPFTEMPVSWQNAFGGPGYPDNPVGKGLGSVMGPTGEVHPLPNVEHPKHLVRSPKDRPAPSGFGAYDISWPQRASKLGTYDQAWLKDRYPGFAADFDVAYFNAAPEDQRLPGFFRGDEPFTIENMHPSKGKITGTLPGLGVRVFVNQRAPAGESQAEALREVKMRLDTVHLFPHEERGILIFRGVIKVAEVDAADVLQIIGGVEQPEDPRPAEHYQTVLAQRMDRKLGYLHLLRDQDLLPPALAGEKGLESRSERKELLDDERLLEKNQRRRTELALEKSRDELRAQGLDPSAVPPMPPPAAPFDIDQIAEIAAGLEADFEVKLAEAQKQRAESERKAREACVENGLDYDQIVRDQKKKSGGPPTFTAEGELAKLRDQAQLGVNAGVPMPHVEAQLADPTLFGRLRKAEDALKEAYRLFGHYQDPAAPRDAAASAAVREEIVAAVAAGESLAGRDFTGLDLSNLDLKGAKLQLCFLESANLSGSDLRGADLTSAMMARADLGRADLSGAKLRGANLGFARLAAIKGVGADLTFAVMTRADLAEADLSSARLVGAELGGALFAETSFANATAAGVTFLKSDLSGLRLTGTDLTKCNFLMANVNGVDFTGAVMVSAVFLGSTGDGAVFRGAKLENLRVVKGSSFEGADFTGAKLDRANLRGTRLAACSFAGASLVGADLSECDLTGADFTRAVANDAMFMKANLTGANLASANLMQTVLQRATIAGASFAGANLFRADLLDVVVDGATVMKDAYLTQIRFIAPKKRDHAPG